MKKKLIFPKKKNRDRLPMVNKKEKRKKDTQIINRAARKLNDDFNSGKLIKKSPNNPLSLLELDKELSKTQSIKEELPKRLPLIQGLTQTQSFEKELSPIQPFKNNLESEFMLKDIQEDTNKTPYKKPDLKNSLENNQRTCSGIPNNQVKISVCNDKKNNLTTNFQPNMKNNRFMTCFPFSYSVGIANKIYFSTQVCWLFFQNWCLYWDRNLLWTLPSKNKNSNLCFYWGLDYCSLGQRNSNFDSLWKIYSHLNERKVKLLLNNKTQKKNSGVIIIYVSRVSFFSDSPINITYETVIENYYPLYEEHHISRFQENSEDHNLHIYWNTENNRFGFIFDGLDVDILKII